MKMYKLLFLFALVFLFSCAEDTENNDPEIEWNQDKSTKMNKELAIEEQLSIKLFLEQHKDWKIEKTGSGLQYYIYKNGIGDSAREGLLAQVEMKVSLLDGTVCYKTESEEFQEFMIDRSNIETGVQEGIKKMRIGDHAKLIIPSHLAHGLIGDMDKIPPLTTIIVDIHLIGLVK